MDVDEARRHGAAPCVDLFRASLGDPRCDGDDLPFVDGKIALDARRAGSIEDRAAANDDRGRTLSAQQQRRCTTQSHE
jgi:hypothetical protein